MSDRLDPTYAQIIGGRLVGGPPLGRPGQTVVALQQDGTYALFIEQPGQGFVYAGSGSEAAVLASANAHADAAAGAAQTAAQRYADGVLAADRIGRDAGVAFAGENPAWVIDQSRRVADIRRYAAGGTNDWTTALQRADTVAAALGISVWIPWGTWKVSATVTKTADWEGAGRTRSLLQTTVDDGSATVLINNLDYWSLKGIKIVGDQVAPKNTIGVKTLPEVTGDGSSRFVLRDVEVQGCAQGWYVHGWIPDAIGVWATYCTLGFVGKELNGGHLALNIEACGEGFLFDYCSGLDVRLLCEGNTVRGGRLKACSSLTLDAPYFESNVGGHLLIGVPEGGETGADVQCTAITITAGKFAGTTSHQYAITADYVDGLDINGLTLSTATDNTNVLLKSHARNVRVNGKAAFGWVHDDATVLTPAFNYCPNPTFKYWLRGFQQVTATRATVSQETVTVRTDGSAMKVSAQAGQNFNYAALRMPNEIRDRCKGRTMRVGAWIYIPNITEYQSAPGNTAYPSLTLNDGASSGPSATNAHVPGHWHFFHATLAVSPTAAVLDIQLHANNSANAATGNEYIIVDSVVLAEETVSVDELRAGRWISHPMCGAGHGPLWRGYGSAAPTSATLTHVVGDEIINTAPALVGSDSTQYVLRGWVCTTAGSPGTFSEQRTLTGGPSAGTTWAQDDAGTSVPIYNYCPNPTFAYWLRGFQQVNAIRSSVTQETATVRTDGSALRITAQAGQTFNYAALRLPDAVRDHFKGRTARIGAWVYVPNITEYQQPANTAFVSVGGSWGVGSTVSGTDLFLPGHWQFIYCDVPVDPAAGVLEVWLHANNSSTAATGNEYIIVDSVVVAETTASLADLTAGKWTSHPLAGTPNGPIWIGYGTAAPSSATLTHAVGDRILNTAPAEAGTAGAKYVINGWVCSVAGSPGTWLQQRTLTGN